VEILYLWRLVAGRLGFVAASCAIAAAGALVFTYILPETYEASTTILIRPQRQVELVPAQQNMLGFPPGVSNPPETISQTYASMMTSSAVAMRVVRALQLDAPPPDPGGPWYARAYRWARDSAREAIGTTWDFVRYGRVETQDAFSAAVARVGRSLRATPVKGTYLFTLTATWNDPEVASRLANTAAAEFTQYAGEARQAEGNASLPFFATQLGTLRTELGGARDRLAAFRARHDVSSLDEQIRVTLETLAQLESQLEDAVNQSAEAQAALGGVDQLLAREPSELHTSGTSVANPVVDALKQRLASDQVRLAALQQTSTAEHPEVRALVASIEEAQQRIAAESARVNASATSELNPFYKSLKQQQLDRSVAAQALAARVDSLRASTGRFRARVAELSSHRGELSRLELDTEVLENQYRLLTNVSEEARLSAAQGLSDLRVLAPATAPLYPRSPIRLFYAVGGFLLGLIGSLFLLLIADYAHPRVRTVDEVARLIGVPTLAQMPDMSRSRSVAHLLGDAAAYEGVISRLADGDSSRRAS
jgi:uncharacterized protein involved in exopolysaccharide biosynthesis